MSRTDPSGAGATMRALLKAPVGRKHIDEMVVTMVERCGRNFMIKVKGPNGGFLTVDRYRLYDADNRRRAITEAEFNSLPWKGVGKDPAHTETAEMFESLEVPLDLSSGGGRQGVHTPESPHSSEKMEVSKS